MDIGLTSYIGKVVKGHQKGRTINFSTINLDPTILPEDMKPGVYATLVQHEGKNYKGALYFGPRLVINETKNVLEIHIFDFNKEIYDDVITFQVKEYVRGVLDFSSFKEMQKQIEDDVA